MAKQNGSSGLQFENEVRGCLKRIGFKDVGGGPQFRLGGYQIDVLAGWDDVLIVAECKCTQSSTKGASIHSRISEFRGKQGAIRKAIRTDAQLSKCRRILFALITKNIACTAGDQEVASQQPEIHLIDFQLLKYVQTISGVIGSRAAIFNLLGMLGIAAKNLEVPKLPAFRIELPQDSPAYLFWCEPEQLLRVAYVPRRAAGIQQYYQRMINRQRIADITRYIQHGGIFPNSIVISFDKQPVFIPRQGYKSDWPAWLQLGELVFPRSYRSCWIIDGQHRLYGFGKLNPNPKAQKLAVFAFQALPEHRQAKYFIDINKEQKPVDPDLIWDLEGEMRPDTERGLIANCAKQLNTIAPLEGKIFVPLSSQRKRGQLKLAGFCQDLEETRLWAERTRNMTSVQMNPLVRVVSRDQIPLRVAKGVASFLERVQAAVGDRLWAGILLRPGGITLALNVYEQILVRLGRAPSSTELDNHSAEFAKALTDLAPNEAAIRTFQRNLTSYAQRRQALREVLLRMREGLGDPDFANRVLSATEELEERIKQFERKFASFVAAALHFSDIAELKQRAPEGVWREVEWKLEQERKAYPDFQIHQAFGLGHIKQMLERQDNKNELMPRLVRPEEGFNTATEVLSALDHINKARVRVHGRRRGNIALVNTYLDTFERLITV